MTLARSPRLELALAGLAFFVSGAAGLVYQVAWQRILALHSGVGIYSIATIVAAFMAGLGLGSALGGRWSARLDGARALRMFGLVELGIAVFGAASGPLYYDWLYLRGSWLYGATWRAVVLHTAALLPPTLLMGMSLPLLVRGVLRRTQAAGGTIGFLYGVNVLGASFGALLTPWFLIRFWGIRGALLAAATGNAAAGLAALALSWGRSPADESSATEAGHSSGEPPGRYPLSLWASLYALSGFCALALEVVWFRMVDLALKATAFTFGTVLSLYLLGLGLGSLAGAAFVRRVHRPLRAFLLLQCVLLAYAGAAATVLTALPPDTPVYSWLVRYWGQNSGFRPGVHNHDPRVMALYVALPFLLFGMPTILMGLAFPTLQRAVQDDVRTSGRKVGLLQAANIAGCVAGSLAVGLLGLQWLGTTGTLRVLMVCGLAFAAVGLRFLGPRSPFLPLGAALLALAVILPDQRGFWLRLHGNPAPTALVKEDATSVCALVPQNEERWAVFVNGHAHSWLPFGGVHTRLGAAPAVVHPAPVDVAIIGLGSGDTAWAAGCRPQTRSVTVFEIAGPQPVLLDRLSRFQDVRGLRRFLDDPRLSVRVADGRNALTIGTQRYDLIEADALWPHVAYAGNLYSVEFFARAAARLKPGGIMCTWGPTPRVYGAFTRAFPYVIGTDGHDVLIGSNQPIVVDQSLWKQRLFAPEVVAYLGQRSADDLIGLLTELRPLNVGQRAPRRYEPNLDLFPRDEFLTP